MSGNGLAVVGGRLRDGYGPINCVCVYVCVCVCVCACVLTMMYTTNMEYGAAVQHSGVMSRVGQNRTYTVYVRFFWQGNYQIFGHIQCI
jgi:hypothetical protein